jgi:hypothetical protein
LINHKRTYMENRNYLNMSKQEMLNKFKNPKIIHCTYPKFWTKWYNFILKKPIIWRFYTSDLPGKFYSRWKKVYKSIFSK